VTGAASGIGRAITLRLAEEGASVGVFDLDGDGAKAVASTITAGGGRAHACRVDVADYTAALAAVDAFEAVAGPTYGLVNNAGWDKAMAFVDSEPEFWRKVVSINLFGVLNFSHIVGRRLVERGRGRIVSIASDAGRVGSSGEAVYSAAKGGTIAFMKTLAREFAKAGVTCNTICPGPTNTPFLATFDAPGGKLVESLARSIPMRRVAEPQDFPGLAAFLLSDEAGYITGQTISVSGGLTMHG
jgi:2-hydroxycyclohexanecarboxyl-CoA dehydrogenase